MRDVLEALYRLDTSAEQWAAGVAAAVAPFLDGDGLGVVGYLYDCRDSCALTMERRVRFGVSDELLAMFGAVIGGLPPIYVAEKYLGRARSLGADLRGWDDIQPVKDGSLRAGGLADLLTINVTELDGRGCGFLSFRKARSALSDRTHIELTCISRHLAAAHRLRRLLESDVTNPANAAAVLDTSGTIHHARGGARSSVARDPLTRATRDMMAARRAGARGNQGRSVDGWAPMVAQRWTLIDHVERDGRRYVLAVENVGAAPGFDLLSAREQRCCASRCKGRGRRRSRTSWGLHTPRFASS